MINNPIVNLRRIFTITFALFFCCSVNGQIIIKGVIVDSLQTPISVSTVKVFKEGIITNFAISNKNGEYSIRFKDIIAKQVTIEVSHLGFATTSKTVEPINQNLNFILLQALSILPEIKVTSSPIIKHQDTILYDPSYFASKQDRSIGDVLRKMPGIEVTPEGQISYNGKIISHYYIEGLDMLGGRYNLANDNIEYKDVLKVEILENHQDKKILQNIEAKLQPALNIRLKETAKNRLISVAKIGAGFDSSEIHNIELNTMKFSKAYQVLNVVKANNASIDISKDIQSHSLDFARGLHNYQEDTKLDLLSILKPSLPSIDANRYLFNDSKLISGNTLFPTTKESQLKLNVDYLNNIQTYNTSSLTQYYYPLNTLIITENQFLNTKVNLFKSAVEYTVNSKKTFLSNISKYESLISEEKSDLYNGVYVHQKLFNSLFQFSNDLSIIKRVSKSLVQVKSFFAYKNLPQQLEITPGLYSDILNNGKDYSELIQNAQKKQLLFNNSISTTTNLFSLQQKFQFNVDYRRTQIESSLNKIVSGIDVSSTDTFKNNLTQNQIKISGLFELNYYFKNCQFKLQVPISEYNITQLDPLHTKDEIFNFTFVMPSLEITKKIGQYFEISTFVNTGKDLAGQDINTEGYILTSYRNLNRNADFYVTAKTSTGFVLVTYRNALKALFANASYNYSEGNSNSLYHQEYSGVLQTNSLVSVPNTSTTQSFIGTVSKNVIDFKTNVSFNLVLLEYESFLNQNNILLPFRNYSTSFSNKIACKKIKNMYFENNFRYSISYSEFGYDAQKTKANLFLNSSNIYLFLPKEISFNSNFSYFKNNAISTNSQEYLFIDVGLTHKHKQNEFSIKLNNLTNIKYFERIGVSQNFNSNNRFALRGTNIMLQYSFKLL